MDEALVEYDEARKNTDKETRNAVCQDLADKYVAAHPELSSRYGGLSIPQLVALVDAARAAGDEEERIRLDVWIDAAFEYQTIGGAVDTSGTRRMDVPAINAAGTPRR